MSPHDDQVTVTHKWFALMSPSLSVLDQLDSPVFLNYLRYIFAHERYHIQDSYLKD